jgi:hypothetical protein
MKDRVVVRDRQVDPENAGTGGHGDRDLDDGCGAALGRIGHAENCSDRNGGERPVIGCCRNVAFVRNRARERQRRGAPDAAGDLELDVHDLAGARQRILRAEHRDDDLSRGVEVLDDDEAGGSRDAGDRDVLRGEHGGVVGHGHVDAEHAVGG